jgi:hypothetical protein
LLSESSRFDPLKGDVSQPLFRRIPIGAPTLVPIEPDAIVVVPYDRRSRVPLNPVDNLAPR